MRCGEWAVKLRPGEDELLSSYLVRSALAHGSTPYRFLSCFWPGRPIWNRDIDRDPPDDWLRELSENSGTGLERLKVASLDGLAQALCNDKPPPSGRMPFLLAAGVFHRMRRRHGLQFCPQCLGEAPAYFRRLWRVGLVLHCPLHGTRLLDGCPHCDAPVIPHRVLGPRIDRCWSCHRSLLTGRHGMPADAYAHLAEMERLLVQLLQSEEPGVTVGPWHTREAFVGLRTLIAVSAAVTVDAILRRAFSLPAAPPQVERRTFEMARWSARAAALDVVAAWIRDWPTSFQQGAAAASLTQRSFARRPLPGPLGAEVARLPEGQRRRRDYIPVIETVEMRRLRRRDHSRYRMVRAARLMEACGWKEPRNAGDA